MCIANKTHFGANIFGGGQEQNKFAQKDAKSPKNDAKEEGGKNADGPKKKTAQKGEEDKGENFAAPLKQFSQEKSSTREGSSSPLQEEGTTGTISQPRGGGTSDGGEVVEVGPSSKEGNDDDSSGQSGGQNKPASKENFTATGTSNPTNKKAANLSGGSGSPTVESERIRIKSVDSGQEINEGANAETRDGNTERLANVDDSPVAESLVQIAKKAVDIEPEALSGVQEEGRKDVEKKEEDNQADSVENLVTMLASPPDVLDAVIAKTLKAQDEEVQEAMGARTEKALSDILETKPKVSANTMPAEDEEQALPGQENTRAKEEPEDVSPQQRAEGMKQAPPVTDAINSNLGGTEASYRQKIEGAANEEIIPNDNSVNENSTHLPISPTSQDDKNIPRLRAELSQSNVDETDGDQPSSVDVFLDNEPMSIAKGPTNENEQDKSGKSNLSLNPSMENKSSSHGRSTETQPSNNLLQKNPDAKNEQQSLSHNPDGKIDNAPPKPALFHALADATEQKPSHDTSPNETEKQKGSSPNEIEKQKGSSGLPEPSGESANIQDNDIAKNSLSSGQGETSAGPTLQSPPVSTNKTQVIRNASIESRDEGQSEEKKSDDGSPKIKAIEVTIETPKPGEASSTERKDEMPSGTSQTQNNASEKEKQREVVKKSVKINVHKKKKKKKRF